MKVMTKSQKQKIQNPKEIVTILLETEIWEAIKHSATKRNTEVEEWINMANQSFLERIQGLLNPDSKSSIEETSKKEENLQKPEQ